MRGSSKTRRRAHSRRRTGRTRDDRATRNRLLEIAGQVFAQKGLDRTTGKEICARAGTNAAAINYHFGSFDRLYAAVLCEAHRRLATLESLQSAVAAADDAEAKLEAVIRLIVSSLTGPVSSSWVVRVLGREIVAPSPAMAILRKKEAGPKIGVIRHVVAELMGLPEDHPAVARGCVSVMAPCFMLLVADRRIFKRMFPRFEIAPGDAEAIVRHLVRFAVAGVSAVATESKRGT
jgi:TetR/AcrR family transcriptional regulator, regulator of cefoperazone and chloramphenicol sensitivity